MFAKQKGSITIFICILLVILIPLSCIMTDVVRYRMAKKQAEAALKICADSVLAAYDRQLKDQYGLLAIYPRDEAAINAELFELLSDNLNAHAWAEGKTDLYGFQVRKVEAVTFYNLSEPYVLNQHIAEFMKYRAPVQAVGEFLEKIKIMSGTIKETEIIEKKMELDKLMNEIRESLVTIHFMLNDKLAEFNVYNAGESLKDYIIEGINKNLKGIKECEGNANSVKDSVNKSQNDYIKLYPAFQTAEANYKSASNDLEKIKSELNDKESALEEIHKKIEETTETETKKSLEEQAEKLQEQIKQLQENHEEAQKTFDESKNVFLEKQNQINEKYKSIEKGLKTANFSLIDITSYLDNITDKLLNLKNHISLHKQFHTDLIDIITRLEPQLKKLEKESASLKEEIENNGGSASDMISGDLEKKLKCIEVKAFSDILSTLENNLQQLDKWESAINECINDLNLEKLNIGEVVLQIEKVLKNPQNENCRYNGYNGYENISDAISSLENELSDLKLLSKMEGVYSIPGYKLYPAPVEVEKNSFTGWFNERYGIAGSVISEPEKDESELNEFRGKAEDLANEVGTLGNEENGKSSPDNQSSDNNLGEKEKSNLPSVKGETSSLDALKRIEKDITAAYDLHDIFGDNLLEKPIEGVGTVNENQKNFFDFAINRIAEIFKVIRDWAAGGIEGLVEGLYVNEYIVSAFKSAVTADNKIPNDIGWGRPLQNTFFDKGEVEYIIFGNSSEQTNIDCAKGSIWAIRLAFNLLHVYTDPAKLATTLKTATAIAGWTIFGVPVVQNFLIISWAGLESYVDMNALVEGKSVPLIKTRASWQLSVESIGHTLKDVFLKNLKGYIGDKVNRAIDDIAETVEEKVTEIINAKVDNVFSEIETKITKVFDGVATKIELEEGEYPDISEQNFLELLEFEDMDSFTSSLENALKQYIGSAVEKLESLTLEKLNSFKEKLKSKLNEIIFKSNGYKTLVEKVKGLAGNLLDKGFTAAEGAIDKVFGKSGAAISNNFLGRLVMMDYTDYLRIMLLAVPGNIKALRVSDLMQLNLQKVSDNKELSIGQYKTFVFIRAEIDFNTWFIPEEFYKKDGRGMIEVVWSQGY